MAKKVSFQCTACQVQVEVDPTIVSRAMQEAGDEKKKDILVTCRDRHLNKITIDSKKGGLLQVEVGRVPV
ncbi:MAG: hypothetical protein ACE5OZ_13045 [Candidatus Heimdallarchaeota archaeon]